MKIPMNQQTKRNYTRMAEWLMLAILFYTLSFAAPILLSALPVEKIHLLETLTWKLGNAVVGAFLGYWADRTVNGRIDDDSHNTRRLARAVIVVGFIVGISGGV